MSMLTPHSISVICKAFVPEWSKGADLSSAIERCVGSNPTGCIFVNFYNTEQHSKQYKKDSISSQNEKERSFNQ